MVGTEVPAAWFASGLRVIDIANPLFSSDDAASWHYATKGRMVWALRAHGDQFRTLLAGPRLSAPTRGDRL